MDWIAATATARGRHHEATGLPNEDHARVSTEHDDVVLGTVADGHGAPTYTRAKRGSRLACDAALEVLSDPPEQSQLAAVLVEAWRARVAEDVRDDPPPRQETRGQPEHVLYGTTVLGARIEPDRALLAQLGDGDLLLWSRQHGTTRPLPNPPTAFPNATDSLVQTDAIDNVRTTVVEPPDLVLLATDGLEAARSGPEWAAATMQELHDELVDGGPDDLAQVLQRWAQDAAQSGGDDTTLAVLLRRDLLHGS